MSEWAPKVFWTKAEAIKAGQGWTIALDGRAVRTPAKAPLVVPTHALAQAIADEWAAQDKTVQPATMPFTRMANAAIDKVTIQHGEVADMLSDYGDSDLLCYRADHPKDLVARQAAAWDPLLTWADQALAAPLERRTGVIHAPQNSESLAALRKIVHAMDEFKLAAFHDLVTLTGSLVIGLAATFDAFSIETLWAASRVDEQYQIDQWGDDEDAAAAAEVKHQAFLHAQRFFVLS